jgi:hypothetical protein
VHKINLGIPFYVGKGYGRRAFQLEGRSQQHQTIQKKYGCNVEIIYYTYDQKDAYNKEIEMIAFYHTWMRDTSRVEHCCNKDLGGQGGWNGRECTQETRQKIIEANNKPVIKIDKSGRRLETFISALEASKSLGSTRGGGISACCLRRLDYAGGFIWRHVSENLTDEQIKIEAQQIKEKQLVNRTTRIQNHQKKIKQCLPNNEIIAIFDSMLIASKTSQINKSNIASCCRGERDYAGGFRWYFIDDEVYELEPRISKRLQPVNCYTIENLFVQKCKSISDMSRVTGVHNSTISLCCRGLRKSVNGLKFYYADQDHNIPKT